MPHNLIITAFQFLGENKQIFTRIIIHLHNYLHIKYINSAIFCQEKYLNFGRGQNKEQLSEEKENCAKPNVFL